MVPGFMQVGHGKLAPLKRIQPGDLVTYYSPTITQNGAEGGKEKCQSFVSFGIVESGDPYAFDMGGFVPFRRNVRYLDAVETPIAPLLDAFDFVEDRSRWGYKFRFGLFSISDHDMALIAQAMQVDADLVQLSEQPRQQNSRLQLDLI
jgi:EVE domain